MSDKTDRAMLPKVVLDALDHLEHYLLGLESVRRCNEPMPGGDGMQLCDLWPKHEGPHVHGETSTAWRRNAE